MAETWDQERVRKLIVRGLGWCVCVSVWTAALLTIYPVEVGEAVMPETLHFSAAKFLHVAAYAFLTVYLSWLPLSRRGRWLGLAFLSLHAAGTEFFQQFVPGRHPAITDVLIDHAGLLLGMALTWKRWLSGSAFSNQRSAVSNHQSAAGFLADR
jgi:VanZ family protein